MGKHTPGPWEVDAGNSVVTVNELSTPTTQGILQLKHQIVDFPLTEEGRANAELTALAPEMLEALKLTKAMIDNLFTKGNVPWGQTFDIDFGTMNQALLAVERALQKAKDLK